MYHFYPCKTQLEFSFPPTVLQGFHCIPHKTYSFPSNIIITPCKYLQCGQRTSDVQHNSVWLVLWTRIWANFNPYKTCKLGWGALLPSKRSPSLFCILWPVQLIKDLWWGALPNEQSQLKIVKYYERQLLFQMKACKLTYNHFRIECVNTHIQLYKSKIYCG